MADATAKPAEADKPADSEASNDKPAGSEAKVDTTDKRPAKAGSKDEPAMRVRVASPFKVFYDDEALSLSGVNATGPFDILPHHHNFISLLNECELAIRTKAGVTRVRISGGFMHVKADLVVVFLNV